MTERAILNLDETAAKRDFIRGLAMKLGTLVGRWQYTVDEHGNITIKRFRPRRSNKANAYYFACVVPAFQEFLREQGQFFTTEEIHEFLKAKLLPVREIHDPNTGEVIGAVPARSSELDSAAFARFVDDAINWLGSTFGIVVPDPSLYRAA